MSTAGRLMDKRQPGCADHSSEIRPSVNWKHSTTASSLKRVIRKEISSSSKIYKLLISIKEHCSVRLEPGDETTLKTRLTVATPLS